MSNMMVSVLCALHVHSFGFLSPFCPYLVKLRGFYFLFFFNKINGIHLNTGKGKFSKSPRPAPQSHNGLDNRVKYQFWVGTHEAVEAFASVLQAFGLVMK
jgi:hypothetical protein